MRPPDGGGTDLSIEVSRSAGMRTGRVLLLHGIARSAASMAKLDRRLTTAGFRTLNVDFPSTRLALDGLAADVRRRAAGFLAPDGTPLHFVTHSMGGLLARVMLAQDRVLDLGRVVMLGPPNQGSEIADLLDRTWLYRSVFGPAGEQLTTHGSPKLPSVDYALGVIAWDRFTDPFSWFFIPGPNDGKVAVARTMLPGMADHVTLHATHTFLPQNNAAIHQTIHFLRHGLFLHGASGSHEG
jgi:pimeloyl-ACP methyl ester carboxylesterase